MNKMIDLSLSRKELEWVSEINMDEWIERFNALAKEFGSCYGPNGVPCVSVGWFDVTTKTMGLYELDGLATGDDDYHYIDPDMMELLEGKTITIKNGCFELETEYRTFGLEFITTDGKKIRAYTKGATVGLKHHIHRMGNNRKIECHFLKFDNNPRRLATRQYGSFCGWDSDYSVCMADTNGNEFCLGRVINLTKEEVDTLLAQNEIPEQCKKCNWSSCPVFKKFNQQ